MTLPFGIDISRYQYSSDGSQKPDFDKMNTLITIWNFLDSEIRRQEELD